MRRVEWLVVFLAGRNKNKKNSFRARLFFLSSREKEWCVCVSMLDLARVFSTFTLEREWIYICTSARGFSYPSGKAKKKKTRLSFFTSFFLLYGPFYWSGIFNVRWTYKQGDDGNRKASFFLSFFLSIFLSSLSFVLLIRLDFYPQWNSNNEIWCALTVYVCGNF